MLRKSPGTGLPSFTSRCRSRGVQMTRLGNLLRRIWFSAFRYSTYRASWDSVARAATDATLRQANKEASLARNRVSDQISQPERAFRYRGIWRQLRCWGRVFGSTHCDCTS